jgi:hypothetical protein
MATWRTEEVEGYRETRNVARRQEKSDLTLNHHFTFPALNKIMAAKNLGDCEMKTVLTRWLITLTQISGYRVKEASPTIP